MARLTGVAAASLLLLLGGCASAAAPEPVRPAAPSGEDPAVAAARDADDAALEAARDSLAPLEGHFLAVADGRILGGTLLPEDTAGLLYDQVPDPYHAYFFVLGTAGNRRESPPALYEPRLAGRGLLEALGLASPAPGEARRVRVLLEPASGLGTGTVVDLVVARDWPGAALVDAGDAAAMGLARSEIPGAVDVVELLTGKTLRCRRALVRASVEDGGEAAPRPPALVEVLYPR